MLTVRRFAAGLAVATAVLAGTPAICADAAPSAKSLELSKRLFSEMHMDQLMDGMMKQMAPAMIAQARQANPRLTDEQARAITEAATESSTVMMQKVMTRMAPLYAETFTEKELQDLVNFYDSPTGHAMIEKMPLMMAKVGPIVTELMPQVTADVQRRVCAKTDCAKMSAPPKPTN